MWSQALIQDGFSVWQNSAAGRRVLGARRDVAPLPSAPEKLPLSACIPEHGELPSGPCVIVLGVLNRTQTKWAPRSSRCVSLHCFYRST